jgi:hypothetical protein
VVLAPDALSKITKSSSDSDPVNLIDSITPPTVTVTGVRDVLCTITATVVMPINGGLLGAAILDPVIEHVSTTSVTADALTTVTVQVILSLPGAGSYEIAPVFSMPDNDNGFVFIGEQTDPTQNFQCGPVVMRYELL